MILKKLGLPMALCMALAACEASEDKAEAHFQRGLELLAEGDEDRARVEFRNAVRLVDTHIEARLELGRLNLKNNELRPAYRAFRYVAEQNPNNIEAQIALTRISFTMQNWEAFERHLEDAAELEPNSLDIKILNAANSYREATLANDAAARQSAASEIEELRVQAPDDDVLRQVLLDVYLSNSQFTEALDELEKSIADDPQNVDLYNLRIQVLARLQRTDDIEAELRKMAELFPKQLDIQGNLLRFLLSQGKTDDAEALLRESVSKAGPLAKQETVVVLVQFLLSTKGPEAAIAELDAAIAEQPEAFLLQSLRASLTFDQGERDAAIADMQNIISAMEASETFEQQETRSNIKVTLAQMLMRTGNEVGAQRLVDEVLAEDDSVVSALKMRANWMIDDDNTGAAITAMRTALSVDPQDIEAMAIMARAYERVGNTPLMLDFLSLAVETSNNAPQTSLRYANALRADDKTLQAETTLIASLRLNPDNVDLLTALGAIYLTLDDAPRAQQVLARLKEIGTDAAVSIATNMEVQLLADQNGPGEVITYLESLSETGSDDLNIQVALIQAHVQNGEREEALSLAQTLSENNPQNPNLRYLVSLTQLGTGNLDGARATLRQLVEDFPTADGGWAQLARLQTIDNDPQTVLATLDQGLEANPGSGQLLWAKASYLQEKGDIDGAIAIYEELYTQNSNSVVIANNLASLITTFRRDEESLERARVIAQRLQGTDVPAFQDTYGWILHRTGRSEEALEYLEPAAAGLPQDAAVQYHLGAVYKALGQPEKALQQMRRAVEIAGPLGATALLDEIKSEIAVLEAGNTATDQ